MITLSFSRFGDGVYLAHTDVLRALNRTMRRAGIDINYSRGYNKHMALKMSQPLPLGIRSDDEWVTADIATDMTKELFFEKFRQNCPPFLKPNCVFETEKNPNLAAKVIASSYRIQSERAIEYKEEIERLKDGFTLTVKKDGKEIEKDMTGYIYSLTVSEGVIEGVFCYGNKNLRSDLFCGYLNEKFNLGIRLSDVTRTKQLVDSNGVLIPAEKYMETIS